MLALGPEAPDSCALGPDSLRAHKGREADPGYAARDGRKGKGLRILKESIQGALAACEELQRGDEAD